MAGVLFDPESFLTRYQIIRGLVRTVPADPDDWAHRSGTSYHRQRLPDSPQNSVGLRQRFRAVSLSAQDRSAGVLESGCHA
jgi:hypothetical protein